MTGSCGPSLDPQWSIASFNSIRFASSRSPVPLRGGIISSRPYIPGANDYRRHELVCDSSTARGTYLLDGIPIRTWTGETLTAQNTQAWWGANSSAGKGRIHHHHVQFSIANWGTVAEYSAGFEGSPVIAPHPTSQDWTANGPARPGTVIDGPVSPDLDGSFIGVPLNIGLETDERGMGFPRLFGRRMDIGAFELQTPLAALWFSFSAFTAPCGLKCVCLWAFDLIRQSRSERVDTTIVSTRFRAGETSLLSRFGDTFDDSVGLLRGAPSAA